MESSSKRPSRCLPFTHHVIVNCWWRLCTQICYQWQDSAIVKSIDFLWLVKLISDKFSPLDDKKNDWNELVRMKFNVWPNEREMNNRRDKLLPAIKCLMHIRLIAGDKNCWHASDNKELRNVLVVARPHLDDYDDDKTSRCLIDNSLTKNGKTIFRACVMTVVDLSDFLSSDNVQLPFNEWKSIIFTLLRLRKDFSWRKWHERRNHSASEKKSFFRFVLMKLRCVI